MRFNKFIQEAVQIDDPIRTDKELIVLTSTGQEVKELWLRGDGVVIIEVEEIKQDKNSEAQG